MEDHSTGNPDDHSSNIEHHESSMEEHEPKDNWKNYIGSDESNKMEIVIRYPNGNKEKVMFPSDSKLKVNGKIFNNIP